VYARWEAQFSQWVCKVRIKSHTQSSLYLNVFWDSGNITERLPWIDSKLPYFEYIVRSNALKTSSGIAASFMVSFEHEGAWCVV
jgi:hypothetical protein